MPASAALDVVTTLDLNMRTVESKQKKEIVKQIKGEKAYVVPGLTLPRKRERGEGLFWAEQQQQLSGGAKRGVGVQSSLPTA